MEYNEIKYLFVFNYISIVNLIYNLIRHLRIRAVNFAEK